MCSCAQLLSTSNHKFVSVQLLVEDMQLQYVMMNQLLVNLTPAKHKLLNLLVYVVILENLYLLSDVST